MPAHATRRSTVLVLMAALALSACGGPERRGDAEVDVSISVAPGTVGPALLTVSVVDQTWRPLNGADVTVTAIPPAGPARDAVHAAGVGAGRYQVTDFPLDAAGPWTLQVRVDIAGGRWAEFDLPLTVDDAAG